MKDMLITVKSPSPYSRSDTFQWLCRRYDHDRRHNYNGIWNNIKRRFPWVTDPPPYKEPTRYTVRPIPLTDVKEYDPIKLRQHLEQMEGMRPAPFDVLLRFADEHLSKIEQPYFSVICFDNPGQREGEEKWPNFFKHDQRIDFSMVGVGFMKEPRWKEYPHHILVVVKVERWREVEMDKVIPPPSSS